MADTIMSSPSLSLLLLDTCANCFSQSPMEVDSARQNGEKARARFLGLVSTKLALPASLQARHRRSRDGGTPCASMILWAGHYLLCPTLGHDVIWGEVTKMLALLACPGQCTTQTTQLKSHLKNVNLKLGNVASACKPSHLGG